ncbi:MAG: hypothetical protein M3Y89_18110 [Actinomycetota bacterium]|nr:hypothetical protein [Actinomycetota bacterium]
MESTSARALADLNARFEDLQTVLRCCERLVTELKADPADGAVVEGLWTTALLSYARCFSVGVTDTALTEADLTATQPHGEVLDWHKVLLQLRDHYADRTANPRERFSVGAALDDTGAAEGIAITSAQQPLVDDVTVRQTGAIAYALSELVNGRITAQQEKVFGELKVTSTTELAKLSTLDIVEPD